MKIALAHPSRAEGRSGQLPTLSRTLQRNERAAAPWQHPGSCLRSMRLSTLWQIAWREPITIGTEGLEL